jgi:microcompartment protein CcmL/EutN
MSATRESVAEEQRPSRQKATRGAHRQPEPPVLGVHEYANTAVGLEAIDAAAKNAPVKIISVQVVNPGKLVAALTGSEAAVELALAASRRVAGDDLIDALFLPFVEPEVIHALEGPSWERWDALCVVETATICGGIMAADIAAKRADVEVAEIRIDNAMGGRASVRLVGPIGEIQAALAAATEYAAERGILVRAVRIPNPHEDLRPHLAEERSRITW